MWDQHVWWMFHTWMNMWSTFKGRWRTKSLDRQLATDVFARETWQWEISKQKGGFNGNIFYKRWIFHWHVRLQPPRCFGLSFCRWLVLHTKPQTTAWFFQKHNGNLSPVHGSNFKTTMHLCRFLAFETQRTLQISGGNGGIAWHCPFRHFPWPTGWHTPITPVDHRWQTLG